jgi:Zn-dependent M28 family amino/carboxypeptidase
LGTITRRNNDLLVTGGRRPTTAEFLNNLPAAPQINMTASSYDAIARHMAAGEQVLLEFDIRNYFRKGPIPIHNVVADIPGREFPDEYVIVGGHIDSWDGATGATDNGTGVASTLEAARILMESGVRAKRTIRFMLWSGEEQGILGSRAYVEAHPELMPKVSAVLVHDLGTQYLSSISGLSYQLADLNDVFSPVMSLNPAFPFRVRSTDSLTSLGSDHRSFVRAGVPAFFWGQSGDGFNYWDSHHSQHDTYDKAVPEYQEHSSIIIALAAYGLANLDHLLPRQGAEVDGEE